MNRSAELSAREAKIAELKRLITSGHYETIDKLEDAVDRLMWSERDQLQDEPSASAQEITRAHPR